jgi:osmoprotectant transport system permease protein
VIDWAWIGDHLGAIAGRLGQHIELTVIALVVGFAISLALALVSVRRPRAKTLVIGITGVLFTIPSLALFAAFTSITGLSILTAEIPLILYTLVIYVRNMLVGLESVPADVLEAADASGFRPTERLLRIELPLAIPLIVSGVRLASVSTIGLVTITSTIGDAFGGLGFFIKERPFFATEVLVGAIGSILLALAADFAFARIQRRLTPWSAARVAVDPR